MIFSCFPIALIAVFMASTNTGVSGLEVGDNICVEGYVMDLYCIENTVLLDNPSVQTLKNPDMHSLHCLVDVGVCVDSLFEILIDPIEEGMEYGRGFQIVESDDGGAGKELLVDIARSIGTSCTTCYGGGTQQQGFRAVVNATLVAEADGDTPYRILVHDAEASMVDQENPCQQVFGMEQTIPNDTNMATNGGATNGDENAPPTSDSGSGGGETAPPTNDSGSGASGFLIHSSTMMFLLHSAFATLW